MYKTILNNFLTNPRDVHTVPMRKREPKWFFVFVEGNKVFVEPGHSHENKSTMKNRICLKEEEADIMLELYHRRSHGDAVSKEATSTSWAQVYWYGIFNELGL